jgi:hypothetical protein
MNRYNITPMRINPIPINAKYPVERNNPSQMTIDSMMGMG